MTEKLQCYKQVGNGWHKYRCRNPRKGKLYCGVHDLQKVAAREQKRKLQQNKDDAKLKDLHDKAVQLIKQLNMGRPNGSRYDKKNPVCGVALTFAEAERLLYRLQK